MTITIRTRTKPQHHADPAPVTVPEIEPTPVSLTAEQRKNMMAALFQAPIDDAGLTDSNAALNNLRAEIHTLRAELDDSRIEASNLAGKLLDERTQHIATLGRNQDLICELMSLQADRDELWNKLYVVTL